MRVSLSGWNQEEIEEILVPVLKTYLKGDYSRGGLCIFVECDDSDE